MMQWALGGLDAADTDDEGGAAAHRRMLQDTSNLRGTTTDDVTEADLQFVPTVTRERFDDLQRLQAQQEQRDNERQQNPPESIVDPPGFRSKWKQSTLEYFNAEIAYNKNRTNDIRVNRHRLKPDYNNNNNISRSNNGTKSGDGVVDDNVSSSSSTRSTSALGRSWVPLTSQRKDFPSADARRRQEARAWERQRATAGIYSNPYLGWETRTALTTSVPTKTWTPYLEEKNEDDANKKKDRSNDTTKPASVSWAPHVDPNNPEALTPYPPQNAVARSKRRGDGNDYGDDDEEIIEEEIIDDDDSSGKRSGSGSTSSSESYEIEIVDDSEYTDNDSRQQQKPNSFVPPQVRRTLSSHSSQDSSSDNDDSNSDNTDAYFARDAAVGRTNGASGRGKASSSSASSASQSTSSSSDVESGCLGMFSPIEKSDNFQVFDDDCVFSPTRGTMCVMCLCIVCTAVWVVVLLYFFVIR